MQFMLSEILYGSMFFTSIALKWLNLYSCHPYRAWTGTSTWSRARRSCPTSPWWPCSATAASCTPPSRRTSTSRSASGASTSTRPARLRRPRSQLWCWATYLPTASAPIRASTCATCSRSTRTRSSRCAWSSATARRTSACAHLSTRWPMCSSACMAGKLPFPLTLLPQGVISVSASPRETRWYLWDEGLAYP